MTEPWPFNAATLPDMVQVEDGQVILTVGDGRTGVTLAMPPTAALELAARLREVALKVQAEDENAFTALHGH